MKRITLITVALTLYSCAAFADSSWGGGAGTLQQVTDKGATSTAEISVGGLRLDYDDYIMFGTAGNNLLGVTSAASGTLSFNRGFYLNDARVDGSNAFRVDKTGTGHGIYVQHGSAGAGGGIVNVKTSGSGYGIYSQAQAGTTGTNLYLDTQGTGPVLYVLGTGTTGDLVTVSSDAAAFAGYLQTNQIAKVAATGHHARWRSSKYSNANFSDVAVLSQHGSLALGYDVSTAALGSSLVSTDQNVLVASGSVGIKGNLNATGTAYFGGLVTATSGIAFGASGGSDTLDYYDEGTWTPYASATVATCTMGSIQVGKYTRIGNMVVADFRILVTSCTGTGDMYVGNLPFSSNSTTGYTPSCVIGYIQNYGAITANTVPMAYISANDNKINFIELTTSGAGTTASLPIDTDGFAIAGSCTYFTN